MDFNKFDTVKAAEQGADLHIKCSVTLKPLYDNPEDRYADNGKPCCVTLLGAEAPSVRAAAREMQKARAAAKKDDADDEVVSLDDVHDRMVEALVPRVTGFKNVHNGDKPATKKDATWFFNLNRMNGVEGEKSFAEQAAEFSGRRAGYLGNVSGG